MRFGILAKVILPVGVSARAELLKSSRQRVASNLGKGPRLWQRAYRFSEQFLNSKKSPLAQWELLNSSSSALASFRSTVSKPSVNQL